jgi:hypothetical protein
MLQFLRKHRSGRSNFSVRVRIERSFAPHGSSRQNAHRCPVPHFSKVDVSLFESNEEYIINSRSYYQYLGHAVA